MVSKYHASRFFAERVCWALDRLPSTVQEVRVDHGGTYMPLAEELPDCSDIVLQEMRGEGMPKGMAGRLLRDPRRANGRVGRPRRQRLERLGDTRLHGPRPRHCAVRPRRKPQYRGRGAVRSRPISIASAGHCGVLRAHRGEEGVAFPPNFGQGRVLGGAVTKADSGGPRRKCRVYKDLRQTDRYGVRVSARAVAG